MSFYHPIIDFFKNHKVILLVLVVFMTNVPDVFNKFVGDDHLLVEDNVFYSSWKNVPRLFEQGNIHQDRDFFSNSHDYGTGAVSYRPVLSLTYFLDHQLWGNKPFGFHLTNIIIHCLNCVLFYLAVSFILGPTLESLLAAFLFGLHPIQSEAVAVVGYRADVLSAFFVLSSFYCWLKFRSGNYSEMKYYAASLIMYFFALFSKESSVMLPAAVFFYDRLLPASNKGRKQGACYLGFIPVLIFYLYMYVFVFPNSVLSFKLLGGSVANHFLMMGYIWYNYLINFLAPWTVKLLPGEYCPPIPAIVSLETLKTGLVFAIFSGGGFALWRNHPRGFFFLLWFMIFYLPVSNLIPVANPMAYRFMYLPSAGLLTLYALVLYKALNSDFLKQCSRRLFLMFYTAIVLVCSICTLFINGQFKSDFDMGYAMVKHYPMAPSGYVLLGEQYYTRGGFDKAKDYFVKAIQYGYDDPQIDMQLGVCYFHLGDFENSKQHLLSVIAINPDYLDPYLTLGNIYYFQKKYEQESQVLEKALTLAPNESSIYINLMNTYKHLREFDKAGSLLQSAKAHLGPQKAAELGSMLK